MTLMISKLWAKHIMIGNKTFDEVPAKLVADVKDYFKSLVKSEVITEEQYKEYVGEDYTE